MKLSIYMKSGNVITTDGVVDYKVSNRGNTITNFEVTWENPVDNKLLLNTLDLSNIEGVTVTG